MQLKSHSVEKNKYLCLQVTDYSVAIMLQTVDDRRRPFPMQDTRISMCVCSAATLVLGYPSTRAHDHTEPMVLFI